ncbi:RagB/SusD family nutrient uptake outer membrane protein [Flagellimonas oceanensis]|uniref:RagB/SusD family nutrient uptake outer membrane protein n=1 Tax=Flagellimonas oceanensis TaxID=2499163 RepID=UPI000C92EC35|nr:RagB/SusD family nutrient uptake outer membrane protein [Allomuricauda sp.]
MKKIKLIITCAIALAISSCNDGFLDVEPSGLLSSDNVATEENAEGLVIAAYAGIGNDDIGGPITNPWVYGSVRADDAYKGGGGRTDLAEIDRYEQYNLTIPDAGSLLMLPNTWENYYKAISRINFALRVINEIPESSYPNKTVRMAELRFLRGHCHFILKIMFKHIPYISDDLTDDQILQTTNDMPQEELWNKIADDFLFAYDNLPRQQDQVGRANKSAAAGYLAKLRLYQAYEQDESNQVVGIDQERLEEVIHYADEVQGSLEPDFANNFLPDYENGQESVWAVQFSLNDGTEVGRGSYATAVNSPTGSSFYGCCGFHQASQNMVNAFKTDENGLPLLDTFNDSDLTDPDAYGSIDPRMDHTVGFPGRPFKYMNTIEEPGDMIYKTSWARDPGVYGFYGNMKEQQSPDCSCFIKQGPFIATSVNYVFIRYADILLFKAEALIQLDRWDEALPIINQVRNRAAQSTSRPLSAGASDVYNIQPYASFPSKEFAWKALKFERRLEFAMEGWRFFDLVRWGEAEATLNDYLDVEKQKHDYLSNAYFTAGRDEYYPIPQKEIDFTKGIYTQNTGY